MYAALALDGRGECSMRIGAATDLTGLLQVRPLLTPLGGGGATARSMRTWLSGGRHARRAKSPLLLCRAVPISRGVPLLQKQDEVVEGDE